MLEKLPFVLGYGVLLSKWWVRKFFFPISYILKKVLRCRKRYISILLLSAKFKLLKAVWVYHCEELYSPPHLLIYVRQPLQYYMPRLLRLTTSKLHFSRPMKHNVFK